MDGERFDNWARALARGSSRRRVLKGFIGATGGLIGLSTRSSFARERRGDPQPNGASCSSARDCSSGFCVDGVCCDSACAGQCGTCASGVCSPIPAGQSPAAGHPACPGSGPCQATCDGTTTDSCATFPGAETMCGNATCANGFLTTYSCGGDGTCAPATSPCALYPCLADGSGCATGCQSDDECSATSYCLNGQCVGDQALGQVCGHGGQCQSGICAHGVCCNTTCDGACETCGTDGFCAPVADDTACSGGACCHGECIDTSSDTRHCGACDTACTMIAENAVCHTTVCQEGVCGIVVTPGRDCDDGDACTTGTTCQAEGTCGGGTPVVCPDDDLTCTTISCDHDRGCVISIDEDTCLIDGACYSAKDRNQNNPCQWCDPAKHQTVWTDVPQGIHCLDGNKCNGEEACDGEGTCQAGIPVTCDECHTCNTETGTCDPVAQGAACGSAASCVNGTVHEADLCDASGTCVAGKTKMCTPYSCGADNTCRSSCSQDAPCASGYYCDSNSACQQQLGLKSACTSDAQCVSGACAGGGCCPSNLACGETCCDAGHTCVDGSCTCAAENQCQDTSGNLANCCASANLCQSDGTCCSPDLITSDGTCCDTSRCGDTCCDYGENCFYGSTTDNPADHYFCGCIADRVCPGQGTGCCAAGSTCFVEYIESLGVYVRGCCDVDQACGDVVSTDSQGHSLGYSYHTVCCSPGYYCQPNGTCSKCPACGDGQQCLPSGDCCDDGSVCTAWDGSKTCCSGGTCGDDGSCCAGGCADGEHCVNGACCDDRLACADKCCPSGDTCLVSGYTVTETGTVPNTECCPAARACHTSLGVPTCCPAGTTCTGFDTCCPTGQACGDGLCCDTDHQCIEIGGQEPWQKSLFYCAVNQTCGDNELPAKTECCPGTQFCDGNCCSEGAYCVQKSNPGDSFCCQTGDTDCGDTCCSSGQSCYHDALCCSADRYFEHDAYGNAGFCCDGYNHYVDMDLGLLEVRICCEESSVPYNKGPFGVDMGCCPAESLFLRCSGGEVSSGSCEWVCAAHDTGLLAYEKIWG